MNPTGRMLVTATVDAVFTTDRPCELELWVSRDTVDEKEPTRVYFQYEKQLATVSLGTPLEPTIRYKIPMDSGDTVWLVTRDLAVVGYLVRY